MLKNLFESFVGDDEELPKFTGGFFVTIVVIEGIYGYFTGLWGSVKLFSWIAATIISAAVIFLLHEKSKIIGVIFNIIGGITRALFRFLFYAAVLSIIIGIALFVFLKTGLAKEAWQIFQNYIAKMEKLKKIIALFSFNFAVNTVLFVSCLTGFVFALIDEISKLKMLFDSRSRNEADCEEEDDEDDGEECCEYESAEPEETETDDKNENFEIAIPNDPLDDIALNIARKLKNIGFRLYDKYTLTKKINDRYGLCFYHDASNPLCFGFLHYNDTNFSKKDKGIIKDIFDRNEYANYFSEGDCGWEDDKWICKNILHENLQDDDESIDNLIKKIKLLGRTVKDFDK